MTRIREYIHREVPCGVPFSKNVYSTLAFIFYLLALSFDPFRVGAPLRALRDACLSTQRVFFFLFPLTIG
jgi:hypothetical protein